MRHTLTILLLCLCVVVVNARTINVKRNLSQKQPATQALEKKQTATTSSSSGSGGSHSSSPTIGTSSPASNVKTYYANGVSFQMVEVSGGTFKMGATKEQRSEAADDENPIHKVTLSSYYIGKTEVTQELWQAVMGRNPSYFNGMDKPVEQVTWYDCETFISRLNSLTGMKFRLPTEAEWEFAARGGTKSRGYKYSGSNTLDDVAWYASNHDDMTHAVGTKAPNELGIYDMSGNVYEWCSDWYYKYGGESQTNPIGCIDCSMDRVLRGGSIGSNAKSCRLSCRYKLSSKLRLQIIGLRLCLSESDALEKKQTDTISSLSGSGDFQSSSQTIDTSSYMPNVITYYANGVSFRMIEVRGSTFQMGATNEQGLYVWDDEKPVHSVTLSSYYIGQTEVTKELWLAVMEPSYVRVDKKPVVRVSWDDCKTFISKLNSLTGMNFRLPTEAEWEFAARGGTMSRGYMYSGSNTFDDVAWYHGNSGDKLHDVGTKTPNELGIYDMSGNVWEWCSDWYGDYGSSHQVNPTGSSSGSNHVLRGGCFIDDSRLCRLSKRYNYFHGSYTGLRLCLSESEALERIHLATKSSSSGSGGSRSSSPTIDTSYASNVKTYYANGVSFHMVEVSGGTFKMGATSEQGSDAWNDEKPVHSVTLSSYYIGMTEVTQELWQAVMGTNPSDFKGEDRPVEQVSWDDCQTFISRLNSLTGKNFRLPTEAEWEFAARGGTKSRGYEYSGSNTLDDVAWHVGNSGDKTHDVGTKAPNELGIYDMSGNVYEWCIDQNGDYSGYSQSNPTESSSSSDRVLRGGSWGSDDRYCRPSSRNELKPIKRVNCIGIRLCFSE